MITVFLMILPWIFFCITAIILYVALKEKYNVTKSSQDNNNVAKFDYMLYGTVIGMGFGVAIGALFSSVHGTYYFTYGTCYGMFAGLIIGKKLSKKN